jgi:hypothetical protein
MLGSIEFKFRLSEGRLVSQVGWRKSETFSQWGKAEILKLEYQRQTLEISFLFKKWSK